MATFDELVQRAEELIAQDGTPPTEIRSLMVDLDDAINSPDFNDLPAEERARMQGAYQELRARLNRPTGEAAQPAAQPGPSGFSGDGGPAGGNGDAGRNEEHNPYAEQQMQEAEKMFYGGRYAEAIQAYDQVLQIEPGWDRARQHRSESENYLRTGHIPAVALPAEAATAFGKAQSAARLGRYADAMTLLNRAQAALRQMGIQRWQEGQEFEQKLQQNIDAENVYDEGQYLFRQGQIDEAIDRVETSARATGLPKYNDRAQQYRQAKDNMRSIAEALHATTPDLNRVLRAKADLDALILEHGENPAMVKLKNRMEQVIPNVIDPLKEQIRALKGQADRAETLESARARAMQARQLLEQARSLGHSDEGLDQIYADVDRQLRDLERYEDDLGQASTLYHTNQSWPAAADRLSQGVRARFPNDPGVLELNRDLSRYHMTRTAIKAGGIIIIIVIAGFLLRAAFGSARAYLISLTPTATATATSTATATRTPTPLPTITETPRPTAIPSATPTPLTGEVNRLVWARNGCYESFTAIGRIPADATVRFLPSERRFDNLSRECLLVQYDDGQNSVIGWILIADLK